MKYFLDLLKSLGRGAILYPLMLICAYFEDGGNVGNYFWLEVLIVDVVVCILLFLFIDFELINRIKNKK